MSSWWPFLALVGIVIAILATARQPWAQPLFRWLPAPLWCYALPLAATALGWLPRGNPAYRAATTHLLPVALGLLLFGVDVPSVARTGVRALSAAAIGACGIVVGVPLAVWLVRAWLPPEAWKGAGALAGTWTGGTMNLLALRAILDTPETIFAPLIVVDALIAYGWMALLVAASGAQSHIDRWLRARPLNEAVVFAPTAASPAVFHWPAAARCVLLAAALVLGARVAANALPTTAVINSADGWVVLLVTTVALALASVPRMRRAAASGGSVGTVGLYLVLAATGAQASLEALVAAPAWVVVGLVAVLVHGLTLMLAGRYLRLPLGMLATASQANIGGVVSAPLVGALYGRTLAPVGLLLAVAGNALGTYLGLAAAGLCRWLMQT